MAELVCAVCPVGCRMTVTIRGDQVLVEGNACRRGEEYARNETVAPRRTLTAVAGMRGSDRMLPVRTARPIPKERIGAAMAEIRKLRVEGPVRLGETIIADLAGTGVALVATDEVKI
jgi:CxxC motif-containing protein